MLELAEIASPPPTCARCHYTRQPTDCNPDWQCPGCDRAYLKTGEAADPSHARPAVVGVSDGTGWDVSGGLKACALVIAISLGAYALLHKAPVRLIDGVLVPEAPEQHAVSSRVLVETPQHRITALASYRIKARVLSRTTYSGRWEDQLSPLDLALGWQNMSSNALLDKLQISQGTRFYTWSTQSSDYPRHDIETQSANTHIIPADDKIKEQVLAIREGDIIDLKGYLVSVISREDQGYRWISSLTRDDTGWGACELFYVEEVVQVTSPK